jgi:hypothetical protein
MAPALMEMLPLASAVLVVISFADTSTMIALPRESKWVKSFATIYLFRLFAYNLREPLIKLTQIIGSLLFFSFSFGKRGLKSGEKHTIK